MALFPQYTRDFNYTGKTFTSLVVSEGDAPAEKLIPTAAENANVKFDYAYGPDGQKKVVIAKGKIVQPGNMEYDYETEYQVQTIKIAEPDSKSAIGVNQHNIYQRLRDRFNGNPATVLTRNYIEIPYIDTTGLDATQTDELLHAIHYGVAYADPTNQNSKIVPGDYLKVGVYGNFVKWKPQTITQDDTTKNITVTGDTPDMIVGQAWAVETQLPPAGFLQYFLDMSNETYAEFVKGASYAPAPGTNYYNVGTQKVNTPGTYGDISQKYNLLPFKGIPFLTDGYFKAKTLVSGMGVSYNATTGAPVDNRIEHVRVNNPLAIEVSETGNEITVLDYRKGMVSIKFKDKLAALGDGVIVVHDLVDGEDPVTLTPDENPNRLHLDYQNNTIVLYFDENTVVDKPHVITVDATLVVNPVAGVPTAWDFTKSMGAVRILLMR